MERVSQQSAANAEESAAAGEELTAQAEQLKRYVGDLNALIGGGASNGKGPGLQERASPAGKPQTAGVKSTLTGSVKKALGRRAARPEDVIPFDKGDFKDF
jgi:methyl-accepting chemotaxis protein